MKLDQQELLTELRQLTNDHLHTVEQYIHYSDTEVHKRENADRWSLLENIEHLNRYADFYIPEIAIGIARAPKGSSGIFTSGWLGNKFAMSMKPGTYMTTMSTFKSKNPMRAQLDKSVLTKFQSHLRTLSSFLERCDQIRLDKVKTKTTIPLTRINLGDTLRVVIYHHERHMQQILKIGIRQQTS